MKVGASTAVSSSAILPNPSLEAVGERIAQPLDSLALNPPDPLFQRGNQAPAMQGVQAGQQLDPVAQIEATVQAFQLEIDEKRRAHETANVIVSCLSPFLSSKGPIDDQVWLVLLRLMGKVQGERRDNDIEATKLERLQKGIKAEQSKLSEDQKKALEGALAALAKTESTLEGSRKAHSEEEGRAMDALTSVMRGQHEAVMATLREMRGA